MYAVVRTGGKQYRVSTGEKLRLEKLAAEVGSELVLDEVLLVGEGHVEVRDGFVRAGVGDKERRPAVARSGLHPRIAVGVEGVPHRLAQPARAAEQPRVSHEALRLTGAARGQDEERSEEQPNGRT